MNAIRGLGILFAGIVLSAGCASTSNTGKGAAAGAAAGAILGGIVGNNTGSGNTERGAAIGAVAGGVTGAVIGRQADNREMASTANPDGQYTVQRIPPLPATQPREDIPVRPTSNAVWIPGSYTYVGSGYVWEGGRWEIPPQGRSNWVPGAWRPMGSNYVYVRGHWE